MVITLLNCIFVCMFVFTVSYNLWCYKTYKDTINFYENTQERIVKKEYRNRTFVYKQLSNGIEFITSNILFLMTLKDLLLDKSL